MVLLGRPPRVQIKLFESQTCTPLCRRTYKKSDEMGMRKFKLLNRAIKKDYMHHWIMDNLPAVECTANCRGGLTKDQRPFYRMGFPVGCAIGEASTSLTICTVNNIANLYPEETFINNHIDIVIKYHESDEFEGARVVGLEVQPRSINHKSPEEVDCSASAPAQPFSMGDGDELDLVYTYSVYFHQSGALPVPTACCRCCQRFPVVQEGALEILPWPTASGLSVRV